MHIVIFGAGGRAGRAITAQAEQRGLAVTGVVRDPRRHPDLVGAVTGDVTVSGVVESASAVVNAVTPFTAPPESFDGFDRDYYVRVAENLARAGTRVVEIGLAATLRIGAGRLYEDPEAFPQFVRPFAEARMRGLAAWRGQTTDWVVLTPPPGLSVDAPSTGGYVLGKDTLDPALAAAPLSYADLAVAVLDQIESPTVHREQVAVYHRSRWA